MGDLIRYQFDLKPRRIRQRLFFSAEMSAKCYYSDWLFGYTCTVTLMKVTRPNTCIDWFEGKHSEGKTDADVKHLMIEDQIVEYFPGNIHAIFSGMTHLTIRNCGLLKIENQDLSHLGKLEYLHLEGNKLKRLPENLFENTRNLRDISFDENELYTLSSRLLAPIYYSVEFVSFRNNPIINIFFSKGDKNYKLIDSLVSDA